jgi:hypothetical protein
VDLLTPTSAVPDALDPLALTAELAAIVRTLPAHIASLSGDLARAEAKFRQALDPVSQNESHPVDGIRVELAHVLVRARRTEEAIDLLRARAHGAAPSPELLRTYARYLGPQPGDFDAPVPDGYAEEAEWALRRAAEAISDPKRPMTLYNLAIHLGSRSDEAMDLLDEVMGESRYYRRAWYHHG